MYQKNIDGVMKAPRVRAGEKEPRQHSRAVAIVTAFAKYSAYLLGVVLLILLISLIFKTVILSPVAANAKTTPITKTTVEIPSEAPIGTTPAIFPKVTVSYHGVNLGEYSGESTTVSGALESFNITLGENDVYNYEPSEELFYGMELVIDEVYYEETVAETVIPYNIVEIESQTIPKGTRVVETEGVMGSAEQVTRTKYVNGEPTEDTSDFNRTVEPVDEVVYVGVGGTFIGADGKEYEYSYYLDVTATAYTHTGNRTKMGTTARVGVIAVDPRNIKLGSKVYVTGSYGDYGVCSAEDIGGGIKGTRIDIFLDTEAECVAFGRRKMRVYILED